LFGGGHDDTWTWNGTNWHEETPATRPSSRAGHGLAYDSDRARIVLFGGLYTIADTWEWDGAEWLPVPTVTAPLPRLFGAMAYDRVRRKTLLFGGATDFSYLTLRLLDDTWEWDGSSWTQLAPKTKPTPRMTSVMAYDEAEGKIILFGGCTAGLPYQAIYVCSEAVNDTWEWDGSDWREVHPLVSPPALAFPSMTYDSAQKQLVLVQEGFARSDVWTYRGQDSPIDGGGGDGSPADSGVDSPIGEGSTDGGVDDASVSDVGGPRPGADAGLEVGNDTGLTADANVAADSGAPQPDSVQGAAAGGGCSGCHTFRSRNGSERTTFAASLLLLGACLRRRRPGRDNLFAPKFAHGLARLCGESSRHGPGKLGDEHDVL
jgi:hypothetical protein